MRALSYEFYVGVKAITRNESVIAINPSAPNKLTKRFSAVICVQ